MTSNNKGIIFNIQKFSINDGPGIRTVVFFKGCPLRCKWCSNPESQLTKTQIFWNKSKCLHCMHCVGTCPAHAILEIDKTININSNVCQGCLKCVGECPARVLEAEGEEKTIDEIADIVMQDLPFYEESGGGVTLSGGEFLMQHEFAIELLKTLKSKGIHTCCETTGYASPKIFESVLEYLDYMLFDVKHYDSDKHEKFTNARNELIFNNLKRAIELNKQILPRIPVIPGFNSDMSDAKGLADYLIKAGAKECQLLPFHQFGEGKYEKLGKSYEYKNLQALHAEELEDYRQVFISNGINAFF